MLLRHPPIPCELRVRAASAGVLGGQSYSVMIINNLGSTAGSWSTAAVRAGRDPAEQAVVEKEFVRILFRVRRAPTLARRASLKCPAATGWIVTKPLFLNGAEYERGLGEGSSPPDIDIPDEGPGAIGEKVA